VLAFEDADYRQSALQIACGSRDLEILKRLKPDPAVDDLREQWQLPQRGTSVPNAWRTSFD